jgi:hypothetical protein
MYHVRFFEFSHPDMSIPFCWPNFINSSYLFENTFCSKNRLCIHIYLYIMNQNVNTSNTVTQETVYSFVCFYTTWQKYFHKCVYAVNVLVCRTSDYMQGYVRKLYCKYLISVLYVVPYYVKIVNCSASLALKYLFKFIKTVDFLMIKVLNIKYVFRFSVKVFFS